MLDAASRESLIGGEYPAVLRALKEQIAVLLPIEMGGRSPAPAVAVPPALWRKSKARRETCKNKKNDERSRYVYRNKQSTDKMSVNKSDN